MSLPVNKTLNLQSEFDIVIVGGGMVGAVLALSLKKSRYRVALVEAYSSAGSAPPSFDDRSSALSLGSRRILEACDAWSLLSERVTPIRMIEVSDRGVWGMTRLSADELQLDALGYVIENRCLGQALSEELVLAANIRNFCPARLSAIDIKMDCLHLTLMCNEQPTHLKTRLLVAADGANSTVRGLFGIGATTSSYMQTAIIANITPQYHHGNTAYERFTASGPLAFLPMKNYKQQSRCSVVWTVPSACTESTMALSDVVFLQQLQNRFGYRLGRLLNTGKRSIYPLHLSNSEQSTAERTVFIGNAMQALHPVAGQGFNLGLRDVFALRNMLLAQVSDVDVGHAHFLKQYGRLRYSDRNRTIRFTDGLVRGFSNSFMPLRIARGLGLAAVDSLPWLRQGLSRFSMGLML